MTVRLRGRLQGAELNHQHLLLLPDDAHEADVSALVVAKHPAAAVHAGAELRISRHAALHGPFRLDAGAAAGAGVPAPWRLAWALSCPVERDAAPLPGLGDRDGLTRAFPEGLPVAGERRALDLLLALARRLRGAVRCSWRTGLLVPDPLAWPGLDVRTAHALDSATARSVLAPVCPGLEVAGEHALVAPLPGGCLEVTLDHRDDDGISGDGISDDGADGDGADGDAGSGTVAALRWWPDEPEDAERERPTLVYREQRATAVVAISVMARHLVDACGGSVTDVAGFPVRDLG